MHLIQAKFLLLWTSVALLSTICISKRSQRAALFRLWGFTTIWCSWASLSETLSVPSAGRSVFSVTLTLSLSHHHFPCWLHTLDQMTFFFLGKIYREYWFDCHYRLLPGVSYLAMQLGSVRSCPLPSPLIALSVAKEHIFSSTALLTPFGLFS